MKKILLSIDEDDLEQLVEKVNALNAPLKISVSDCIRIAVHYYLQKNKD